MVSNLPVLIQWKRFEMIRIMSCGGSIFSPAFRGTLVCDHSDSASCRENSGDASSACSVLLA